jgi:hypothetical protein
VVNGNLLYASDSCISATSCNCAITGNEVGPWNFVSGGGKTAILLTNCNAAGGGNSVTGNTLKGLGGTNEYGIGFDNCIYFAVTGNSGYSKAYPILIYNAASNYYSITGNVIKSDGALFNEAFGASKQYTTGNLYQ